MAIIYGTPGDDTLIGGDDADEIYGLEGNDTLRGYPGNDKLFGGPGDDTLTAGKGDDVLRGNEDNDYLDGRADSDRVFGGPGDDKIIYDSNDTQIKGGQGSDTIYTEPTREPLVRNYEFDGKVYLEKMSGIEKIVLNGSGEEVFGPKLPEEETSYISAQDVLKTTSAPHELIILGGSDDTVHLDGSWEINGTIEGNNVWESGNATLIIDPDINIDKL